MRKPKANKKYIMFQRSIPTLFLLLVTCGSAVSYSEDSIVFQEDFEKGIANWTVLDPDTWQIRSHGKNMTFEITERKSAYQPPVRSPGHVALIRDLQLESFQIDFDVRSTKDTGGHRDCCVFFAYQDNQHFYYVHLGAKPDPHSGQIMIVKEAPRKALTDNKNVTKWDDQWHHVRLIRDAKSGSIEVFFDDMKTPHMKVVDKTFVKGQVGIGSFDDLNEFDNVKILRK